MGSVRCEILVFEIAYESRGVVSVAEDSIEYLFRCVCCSGFVDVLCEPSLECWDALVSFDREQLFPCQSIPEHSCYHVAERVAWEVGVLSPAPVDVLEDTLCIVRGSLAEILLDHIIPDRREF